jgi:hypothetical protein
VDRIGIADEELSRVDHSMKVVVLGLGLKE